MFGFLSVSVLVWLHSVKREKCRGELQELHAQQTEATMRESKEPRNNGMLLSFEYKAMKHKIQRIGDAHSISTIQTNALHVS